MELPNPGKYCLLIPVIIVLGAGLLYTGCAFRIRDTIPASSDVCHSVTGRCTTASSDISSPSSPSSSSWSTVTPLRAKRGFETVSTLGNFAKSKQQPPDETNKEQNHQTLKKGYKTTTQRSWSKLNKIEDNNSEEENKSNSNESENLSLSIEEDKKRIENDDEIIQIEVEDDEIIIDNLDHQRNLNERLDNQQKEIHREKQEFKLIDEEEIRKNLEKQEESCENEQSGEGNKSEVETSIEESKELQSVEMYKGEGVQCKKKEEVKLQQEFEEEQRKIREIQERQIKAEAEIKLREEEEQRLREELQRRLKKEEEIRLIQEAEKRKKDEEEQKLKQEAETKRKEEEQLLREATNRRKQEEKEQRLKKEAENKRKEDEEQRLKEEKKKRLKDKEDQVKNKQQLKEKQKLKEEQPHKKQKKQIQLKTAEKDARKTKTSGEAGIKKILEKVRKDGKTIQKSQEQRNEEKRSYEKVDYGKSSEQLSLKLPNKEKKVIVVNTKEEIDSETLGSKENIVSKVNLLEVEKSTEKLFEMNDNDSTEQIMRVIPLASDETSGETEDATSKKIPPGFLSLTEMNEKILSVPTFLPNFTAVEDAECQTHGKIFLRQLRSHKLWALQMLDASAKVPSGLLRGNVNQLGDFDECLGVMAQVKLQNHTVKVQGKYCLATMDVYATQVLTRLPVHLMQSRAMLRGSMYDPGNFIPKFTTINWGICLPAACSAENARKSVESALEVYNMTSGIRFMVDVDPTMCYVRQKSQIYSKETIGVLYFYAIFICLVVVATVRDYFIRTQEKENYSERIIMAFSLKRTINGLLSNTDENSSNIDCIHGLRSLSVMALFVLYKMIPTSKIPYANRVVLTEVSSSPLSSIFRTSIFYSDALLLLNGVITAYNMTKELIDRDEIRWFCRFVVKYIRLTPSLLAIIFWYAFVMEHTGSGPQWNAIIKKNADICKENAWMNMLYVQNFLPFEEMCATHTYQLALDMQLSLIASTLVFFLQIKPLIGFIIVFFLLQLSATLRYFATSYNNLSLVMFHGMTVRHLIKTANMTIILPLHRATPYLFGVTLGVILQNIGKNVRIHKIFIFVGWLVALALGSWSLFSPWRLSQRDYTYNVDDAVHYAVFSPFSTAVALCWIIFACFTDNGGFVNKLLSSHVLKVFSRLSYTIYLSQFIIFFYNIGTTRYTSEFQLHKVIDLHEIISVASVSIILTLLFDIPMQEVKNIIFECTDSISIEVKKPKECIISEEIPEPVKKISESFDLDDEEESPIGGWDWNRGTFTKIARSEPRDYEENDIRPTYYNSKMNRKNMRRQTTIRSEPYDEWERNNMDRRISRSEEHSIDTGRINRMDYRYNNSRYDDEYSSENYLYPRERYYNYSSNHTRSPMRESSPFYRSSSRERSRPKDPEILTRDYSNKPIITISKEDDFKNSNSSRGSMSKFFDQQFSVSESEIDAVGNVGGRRNVGNYNRRSSSEVRASEDETWENDSRHRRNRYHQERVHSQEIERIPPPVVEEEVVNDDWNSLNVKRRSSAEGKMALLKDPSRPVNMELWTVSKMQFGSSQESDDELDEDMYHHQRKEYRETEPPLREEVEEEEEEDINEEEEELRKNIAFERRAMSFDEGDELTNTFALNKNSKRITVQDLSRISSEEELLKDGSWNSLDVKTNSSGLFKRESIIKSQASEEDPEYLLPERPKLVEQEQEHPFKKAWQEQKSRSEEDGTVTFVIKDFKTSGTTFDRQNRELGNIEGEKTITIDQSKEIFEADVTYNVTLNKKAINCRESTSKSDITAVIPEYQESIEDEFDVDQISDNELDTSENANTDT